MPRALPLNIGQQFGRWTVIHEAKRRDNDRYWRCKCDCGTERDVLLSHLRNGTSRSCGCSNLDRLTKHGAARNGQMTPEYRSWRSMKNRCLDPANPRFYLYGERGISVCERWIHSFINFLVDMGKRPAGTSIDRINPDGNYEPSNCHWATAKHQQRHLRTNPIIIVKNTAACLSEWAEKVGLPRAVIAMRIHRGWTPAEALGTPAGVRGRRIPKEERQCVFLP